ncbi:MAG: DeoR/GlpR family DNA-binding transcription regulator [Chloroflexi bacterium]|nr:DeoR/GlpR family DNA-binding transcription regulator [Chloroflexota bacterium]
MNITDSRHKFILENVNEHGSVRVIDLAAHLEVSEMTIRRDLIELERIGLIRRVHGGAISARGRSYEPPLGLRSIENQEVKQRLGRYAAEMIAEGNSISLDIGSTIHALAEQLRDLHNITVITPSLSIAGLFLNRADVRLIIPGGIVRPGEMSMIGDLCRRNLELLFVDRLFLGVGAIDSKANLTEYNLDDTLIKQTMIHYAKEVVLIVDSSKFERVAFAHVAPFNVLQHCIVDAIPPKPLLDAMKSANVTVHVVSEDNVKIL